MSIDLPPPPPPPAFVLTVPASVSQTAGAQPAAAAPVTSQQAATGASISQQDPSTGLGRNTHVVVASPAIPANQWHLLGDWGGIRTELEDAGCGFR